MFIYFTLSRAGRSTSQRNFWRSSHHFWKTFNPRNCKSFSAHWVYRVRWVLENNGDHDHEWTNRRQKHSRLIFLSVGTTTYRPLCVIWADVCDRDCDWSVSVQLLKIGEELGVKEGKDLMMEGG
jgi:hypothetical protein